MTNEVPRTFLRSPNPVPGDVIITEFFPDPTPAVALPEAEYVELYNRTNLAFDLQNWGLGNDDTPDLMPSFILLPGEYVILCEDADTSLFSAYGPVVGMEQFPAITNFGGTLTLFRPDSTILSQLNYDLDWYQDTDKRSGGWSLERIDNDFLTCELSRNWRASVAFPGGTPGEANSVAGVLQDTVSPEITQLGIVQADTLVLFFSEQIPPAFLTLDVFSIDLGIGEPSNIVLDESQLSCTLSFNNPLLISELYTLSYSGLSDCFGNESTGTIQLGIPQVPEPGDILLNEILFNPYPGGRDFVEIYNASDKVIDLQFLAIGEGVEGRDSLSNTDRIVTESQLFLPGTYLCLTTDVDFQKATYAPVDHAQFLEMSGFPGFDDRDGDVGIQYQNGLEAQVLDRFMYDSDFHFSTLADLNGVSLERLSFDLPTQQTSNWHSAASTVGFATPGYVNSQQLVEGENTDEVTISHNLISPDGDGQDDFIAIQYDLSEPGGNARIFVYDLSGRLVNRIAENELLSTKSGSFIWDGTDQSRGKAAPGTYVILVEIVRPNNARRKVYKFPCAVVGRF